MNIIKKEWINPEFGDKKYLIKELLEYNFEGRIDFCWAPSFLYDSFNKLVIDNTNSPTKLLLNDEIVEISTENILNKRVEVIKLSKSFDLQDFFDKHKNAKCIVFFVYNMVSVFHEAYTIRVFIDEVDYTPDLE